MKQRTFGVLSILTAVVLAAAPAVAQQPPKPAETVKTPPAKDIIDRACAAAGGVDAFNGLGTVQVDMRSQEVTADGHTSQNARRIVFQAPGPIPGRMVMAGGAVVAGDDGTGGWALINKRPDTRTATVYMVQRSLQTALFPILLPFSLHWDGVVVSDVAPAVVDGQPTWQLTLTFTRSFFDNPQIGTTWLVEVDRKSYAVLRAESPFVDLGKGITSDGMRFSWARRTQVQGITLPTEQTIIGINRYGRENAHNRMDTITYATPAVKDVNALYANPLPPDQRPKQPTMQLPPGPGGPGGAERPGGPGGGI